MTACATYIGPGFCKRCGRRSSMHRFPKVRMVPRGAEHIGTIIPRVLDEVLLRAKPAGRA